MRSRAKQAPRSCAVRRSLSALSRSPPKPAEISTLMPAPELESVVKEMARLHAVFQDGHALHGADTPVWPSADALHDIMSGDPVLQGAGPT